MGLVIDLDGHLDKLVAVLFGLVHRIRGDIDIAEARLPRVSSSQTMPFMRTRSTTPLKKFSAPMGNCITSGFAPRGGR